LAAVGSAVMVCLSLKTLASVSRRTTTGALQVSPPLVERLANRAWSKSAARNGGAMSLKDRASWYRVPLGPKLTQGSVERW
jgi:hypothetical protein